MEKIGNQKIWPYLDEASKARPGANLAIRGGPGHRVETYFDLAKKVAELQFLNRDHVLLFRGQPAVASTRRMLRSDLDEATCAKNTLLLGSNRASFRPSRFQ
jgi:hypothetical protein